MPLQQINVSPIENTPKDIESSFNETQVNNLFTIIDVNVYKITANVIVDVYKIK